jgi:hypothetical protein
LPQPRRFRQRRSGNLPRSVQLVNNFFSNPEVFFGARREDFSPAQKRELIPAPSRCQPLSSAFFKKNRYCAVTVTTQQLQVVFNTQPKHLHTLPQTPLSVNHFLEFFPKHSLLNIQPFCFIAL